VDPDDFGSEKIHGLAEHPRLRLDSADPPPHHAKAVDHRGVGIGPNKRIGEVHAIPLQHSLGKIL
jgi:hypothetical protein